MTHRSRRWRLARCAVPLLAVALVAAPRPASAEESAPATPPPTQVTLLEQAQLAALQNAPALTVATTAQTATAQGTTSPGTDRSRWSFFKSPGGIIVLSTLAVGVGYWIYSTQHDRINSPGAE